MADEIIREYTKGDTLPRFVRSLPTSKGIANLTGATVRLRMRRSDGTLLTKTITTTLNADGHIDAPTASPPAFFFTFISTDLQAGNLQRAEIEYQTSGSLIATERDVFFDVADALG